MSFEIQKGIPLPTIRWSNSKLSKFPFQNMEIGDSFLYDEKDASGSVRYEYILATASEAGRKLGKKFPGRRQPDGSVRIWRTE